MSSKHPLIYLNNSATSFPKPASVADAMSNAMLTLPEMTGRGEEAASARDKVQHARARLAEFLGCSRPEQVIFTSNSSEALNQAIHGYVDRHFDGSPLEMVTTTNDHNSVLRPLRTLEKAGKVNLIIVDMEADGSYDLEALFDSVTGQTRLMAVNHLSNVVGTIASLEKIGSFCRERGIVSVIDSSQSAGLLEINVEQWQIDLLAITGHKYMFGPTGIGALYIDPAVELEPRKQGGTGVKSEAPLQPPQMPIRFESGTVNYHGIVGLDAGLEYILDQGSAAVRRKAVELRQTCEMALRDLPGVHVYGPDGAVQKGSVVSFRVEEHAVADVDLLLRSRFGIITRSGLHCAPLCHQRLGTFPEGTLRVSFSAMNSENDIDRLVEAVRALTR
jgi:cysteine desulfurase family protein